MSLLFGRRRPEERLISSASVWGTTASGDPIAAWLTDGRAPGEDPLRLAPVWASVRLIADGVASLPMAAVREDADGRKVRLPEQPGLVTAPTRFGTAYDWRFRLMSSLLLHGNAVGLLVEGYRGWPAQVEWLRPDLLDCDEDDKAHPIYYDGRRLEESTFVHVASFVKPGYRWGLSPIGAYRSVLDVGLAAQDYAREWFTEGAPIPKGILRNVEQPVVRDVARSVKESYKRTMKHGDVFVTGKDWEWTSTTLPADDARFIETMKATATQVAAIYGVPPEMIGGETGSSLTYSTVEQNLLNFATLTLRPWVTRLEEALSTLLPRGQRIRFNLDAMVRSDTKTKYDVMKIQKEINLRSINELRALDDLPPVDGGDEVIPKTPEPVAPQQVSSPGSSPQVRHLPGQHNQKDHGRGRSGSDGPAPRAGMGDIDVPVADLRGGSAEAHLTKDGRFTPERQALHDEIVLRAVNGVPASDDPTFHMLGGGTAAGKTTAINSGIVDVPGAARAVQINADDVKAELPEHGTRPDWASFTHEESSYLAKRIQAAAIERGQDFVLDGTGDSSPAKVLAKVDAAHAAGYKVVGTYATVPTDMAVQRSNARGERTGRFVPEPTIRAIHASVSATFPEVASSFDSVTLIDTSGNTPRVLARASRGNPVDVLDEPGYAAFLAKAG